MRFSFQQKILWSWEKRRASINIPHQGQGVVWLTLVCVLAHEKALTADRQAGSYEKTVPTAGRSLALWRIALFWSGNRLFVLQSVAFSRNPR